MNFIRDDIYLGDFVSEDYDTEIYNAGNTADEISIWFLGA